MPSGLKWYLLVGEMCPICVSKLFLTQKSGLVEDMFIVDPQCGWPPNKRNRDPSQSTVTTLLAVENTTDLHPHKHLADLS